MTRETKIGLLVGLAFIIVIGILLSDHMTTTIQPPQASLTAAGNDVRQSVRAPGMETPVVTMVEPQEVTPRQMVPTPQDLTPPAPVVEVVRIGPSQGQPPISIEQMQPPMQIERGELVDQSPVEAATDTPAISQTLDPSFAQLEQTARHYNEEIVAISNGNQQSDTNSAALKPTPAGNKEYKAQPGDTLSKMAGRFLGGNTKANRDALVKANPSMQRNPDVVVAGRTYLIPTASPTASVAANVASQASAPSSLAGYEANSEQWYTVQPGDNLWKIASEQVGSGSAVEAIKALNKSVLKGGDVVQPNMKLRLPAKSLASAN